MSDEPKHKSPFAHLGPTPIERRYKDKQPPKVSAKEKIAKAVESGLVEVGVSDSLKRANPAKKKMGRPATVGKPWEAEGISKAGYYKRRKKAASKGAE